MKISTLLPLAALALAAGAASAANYSWNWAATTPKATVTTTSGGGTFKTLQTQFDSATNNFVLNIVFSNRVSNALTIRVGDGTSNPNNRGEQAIVYFDASTLSSPKLTAYAYNGQSWATSFSDGNGSAFGTTAPDVIHTRSSTGWINSATVADTANNTRTYTLNINASAINSHTPTNPGPNGAAAWDGLRFASAIGLWINSFDTVGATYNTAGQLTSWNTGCYDGIFTACDTTNYVLVPLPPAMYAGMAGLGLVAIVARRRHTRSRND